LLQAILRELPLIEGTVEVGGTISYASQEPWMFTGSVRQNILFGEPFERERYNQVVRVCALKRDFQLLPYADRTIVGERGVSLSGGQRARANLARYVDCTYFPEFLECIIRVVEVTLLLLCYGHIQVRLHF
jgi:ATP-binding cassette subfamily C (CFTR/MRP) protein 4